MMEPEDVDRFTRHAVTLGRKAGHDPAAVRQALAILDLAEQEITISVRNLVLAGYSWADIGRELGISRQAAHKRFALR